MIAAAIIRDHPKPLSDAGREVPRELERIVARCLRKEPDRRFQTAADLKVALEDLREESESGERLTAVPAHAAADVAFCSQRPSPPGWQLALGWVSVE